MLCQFCQDELPQMLSCIRYAAVKKAKNITEFRFLCTDGPVDCLTQGALSDAAVFETVLCMINCMFSVCVFRRSH